RWLGGGRPGMPGPPRAWASRMGRAARRRGWFRCAPATLEYDRGARAGVRAVQAVFRRRAGSALLASGILEKGNDPVLRWGRFRRLRRLGRPALARPRIAAPVSPLHRREPEGFSRT